MAPPTLPKQSAKAGKKVAKNASAKDSALSIFQAQEIELDDGTKIPVQIPNGMPPQQAHALLAYLRANPEAAKTVHAQAQQILKTPGMANAFLGMQSNLNNPDMAEKYAALKDDPDLKVVFDDVIANGPVAFQKYWEDAELMTKVSAKMKGLNMGAGGAPPAAASASSSRAPAGPPANLHDAAKRGDIDALNKFLEAGISVEERNERGVTALGVAVGFNQAAAVTALLAKGAELEALDPAGNTVLHYAAGYGRKAICQQLLDAGANINATNKTGQKPVDAAKMNGEKAMVEFLRGLMGTTDDDATETMTKPVSKP